MDGIYSGILRPRKGSRPIDVSQISQERMQRRQIDEARAAEERKRKAGVIDEVLKNLYVDPKFNNSKLNRVAYEKAAEAVSNVVSMSASGDPSAWTGATKELVKYKQVMSELRFVDDNWTNAAKITSEAVKSGKGSLLYEPATINATGKTYTNLIEFENDPINDRNDKAREESLDNYGVAPFVSQVETSVGTFPVFQVPEAGIYSDFSKEVMSAVSGAADELFSERVGKPYNISVGRSMTEYQNMGLPMTVKEGIASQVFSNPQHIQYASRAAAEDYAASKPEMSRASAMSEHYTRMATDKNYAKSVIKDYGIDKGVMPIVNQAQKRIQNESYTRPAPSTAAPTQSDFRKNFSIMGLTNQNYPLSGSKGKSLSVNEIDYVMGPNKTGAKRTIQVTGEHYVLSDGELEKSTVSQGYEVIPKGVAYIFKDNTLALSYNIPESTQVIYVPFNNKLAEQFMGSVGISRENPDDVEAFRENIQQVAGGQESAVKAITDFIKYFGPKKESGASGTPSSGQAPTGQQSPTSGVIGQTANKAASTGAKPQKIDVTKLTGMDRVRAINQNRANGYE